MEGIPLKVDIEDISSCKKTLKIEIPSEDVNEELEKAYEEVRKSIDIRGFRKGRAPRNIIKMRFGEYIKAEVVDKLIPPAFEEAAEDAELEILRSPDIAEDMKPSYDEISVKENEPLSFEITVDVKPEINIPNLDQLEVEKGNINVPKEDVDSYLEQLREEEAESIPVEDRPVQEGDYVTIDLSAMSGEEVLIEEYDDVIEVGKDLEFPEIAQYLVGMNTGDEKEFPISFPEDHESEKLAGKEVSFHISLSKITERELPDLDDDFARDLDEDDLEHLTAKVWNQLVEDGRREQRQNQEEELLDQLLEQSQFEVPEFMVEARAELQMRIDRIRMGGSFPQGEESEPDEEELEKYKSLALKGIKSAWLLDEIADNEEIGVSDAEVEGRIREIAQGLGRDPVKYRKLMEDTNRIDSLEASIWEHKVFDAMIEKAAAKRTLIL